MHPARFFQYAPLLLAVLPLCPTAAQAQTKSGIIRGIIRDAANGTPLPYVQIGLEETGTGASSSEKGYFEVTGLAAGRYTLLVSHLGYRDLRLSDVAPDSLALLELALEPEPILVEEVVVTASLRSQAIQLAPASIGVISRKQMQVRSPFTFDQAFDEMPGVVVTRSSGANVQAFSIRGASEVAGGGIGNRVLLLIDGRPALSPESGGALWNLVPLNSIERIEVVRGAYSSLYGSSAMGGVVNVVTRKPGDMPETRVHLHYGAYGPAPRSTGYRRYGDFHTAEISHARKVGQRFSYVLDGGWKSDAGHREKTGFDLYNAFGKGVWEWRSGQTLQVSANANRMYSDAPATWLSRTKAYSVANFRYDDYQDRREMNADAFYQSAPGQALRFSSRLYHYRNFSRFTFNDDPSNDSTNINTGKQIVDAYSVRTRRLGNISQFHVELGSQHHLLVGTDIKSDYVLGVPDQYLYGERRAFGAGLYVQDEFSAGDKFSATVGGRIDYYRIAGEVEEANFSPKVAFSYRARPGFSVRGLLAQAFRDPPIAERFIKFEQGGGLAFRPNPGLRPERLVLSAELGAKISHEKWGSIDGALFFNHYKNLISFQQVSGPLEPLTYQVVNLRAARMQGFELSYTRHWGERFHLSASYTFLDARDISSERVNDALAYKVRHTVGASATYRYQRWTLHANARYRSRIEEVFIYPGSEPAAAFIANARLRCDFGRGKAAYFALNNLNDAQYEELERYRMPGRSFALGIEWSL